MNTPPTSRSSFLGHLLRYILPFLAVISSAFGVMQVTNGKLYDSNGSQFIVRGCNTMTLYWDAPGWLSDTNASGDWLAAGDYTFSQLTQTGANTARIFWQYTNGYIRVPATALDATLTNCIHNNLLPIPELHNVTGDGTLATFQTCIDYWTSPDIMKVLKKHENYLLLNIVNEWNVPGGTDTDIRNAYGSAITQLRNAGYLCPLIVDAGRDYAADENTIINNAAYLLNLDPLHNLIFSVHIYDPSSADPSNRGSQARIKRVMDTMISNQICFIWGEFSRYGYGNAIVEWQYLIHYAQQTGTGWMVWAWWNPDDILSLAYNKQFRAWDNDATWTRGVALDSNDSIQQTSIKTLTLPQLDAGVPASNATLPANPVTITFPDSGLVFSVSDASGDANRQGASILQQAYTGANKQRWNLIPDGNGFYSIVSVGSSKVLEIAGGSTALLANIQQGTDYGRNFQRWSITDAGNGRVHLRARHDGDSPIIELGATTDGLPAETYSYTSQTFVIATAGATISATGVSINPAAATINVGNTQQLTITIFPANASNPNVTWTTSDANIATVSTNGLVTSVAVGSATITATTIDGNFTATSVITNNPAIPSSLLPNGDFEQGFTSWNNWGGASIDASSPHGGTNCLKIASGGAGGGGNFITLAPNTTYTFSAWGKCSATPSTPVAVGVQWDGGATQYNLSFNSASYSYQTITFTTPASFSGTNAFIWKSDPAIEFYADDLFLVQGGSTTTAVTGVSVNPITASITVGATQAISASVFPANATNQNITWSSSNTGVATVSLNGLVTAVAPGSATITATTIDGNFTATSAVTVKAPAATALIPNGDFEQGFTNWNNWGGASIDTASPHSGANCLKISSGGARGGGNFITLAANTTYTFSAWGKCSATPSTPVNIGVQWDGGATQYNLNFTSTSYSYQEITFTTPASFSGTNIFIWKNDGAIEFFADDLVLVQGASTAIAVTGVSVNPTSAAIAVGATQSLSAIVSPAGATYTAVTWSSSDTRIATVSDRGLVTGLVTGSATITATTADGGKTATSAIMVTPPPVTITSSSITGTVADQTAAVNLTAEGTLDWAKVGGTNSTSIDHKASGGSQISGFSISYPSTQYTDNAYAVSWSDGLPTVSSAGTTNGTYVSGANSYIQFMVPASNTLRTVKVYVGGYNITGEFTAQLNDYSAPTFTVDVSSPANASMYKVFTITYGTAAWGNGMYVTWKQTSGTGNVSLMAVTLANPSAIVAVTGFAVNPTSAALVVGATQAISATVSPANATNQTVTWSSTNTGVATVSLSGLVTGVGAGSATITATTVDGSFTATSAIAVTVPVIGVSVNPASATLTVNATKQLATTVSPASATNQNVTWSSSDPSIATVSSSGLVTAVAAGSATITATTVDGAFAATTGLTVIIPVTGVAVSPVTVTVALNATLQLTASISPATATNPALSWTSSDTSIATVSSSGLVTAVSVGSATITATTADGGFAATSTITVPKVSVRSVTLQPLFDRLAVGGTEQLIATINPASATNPTVTWKSSNPAVAAVSSTGVVTALARGFAIITVTTADKRKSAACVLHVYEPVTGILVTPTTATIRIHEAKLLHATVSPATAAEKEVTWKSNNPVVATVSDHGTITGHSAGTATITATTVDGGKTASCVVTVVAPAKH